MNNKEHYEWLIVAYLRYLREHKEVGVNEVDEEELSRFVEWAHAKYGKEGA